MFITCSTHCERLCIQYDFVTYVLNIFLNLFHIPTKFKSVMKKKNARSISIFSFIEKDRR